MDALELKVAIMLSSDAYIVIVKTVDYTHQYRGICGLFYTVHCKWAVCGWYADLPYTVLYCQNEYPFLDSFANIHDIYSKSVISFKNYSFTS